MNNQKTINAETIEMMYVASKTQCTRGVKSHEVKGNWPSEFIQGKRVVGGGCGTYITATPARLILQIKIGDKDHDVWTERIFRHLLETKRLTKKTRDKIEATMPETVLVEEQLGRRGRKYYTLTDDTAIDWVLRVLGV